MCKRNQIQWRPPLAASEPLWHAKHHACHLEGGCRPHGEHNGAVELTICACNFTSHVSHSKVISSHKGLFGTSLWPNHQCCSRLMNDSGILFLQAALSADLQVDHMQRIHEKPRLIWSQDRPLSSPGIGNRRDSLLSAAPGTR